MSKSNEYIVGQVMRGALDKMMVLSWGSPLSGKRGWQFVKRMNTTEHRVQNKPRTYTRHGRLQERGGCSNKEGFLEEETDTVWVRSRHRHGGHSVGGSLVRPGSGDSRRNCPGPGGKGSVECECGDCVSQHPTSEVSPLGNPHPPFPTPGLLPPAQGRDRLTLEVPDNVLNAELCEERHDGQ